MKNILKNVIAAGGYKLADMQHRIKKLYAMGDLSEADMDELITLASGGVSADAERPEVLQMLRSLADQMAGLDSRVKALEGKPVEPETDYPAWKSWDGISNEYQPGAVVKHNGKIWISTFTGQNVWEPGTVGDQFWAERTV